MLRSPISTTGRSHLDSSRTTRQSWRVLKPGTNDRWVVATVSGPEWRVDGRDQGDPRLVADQHRPATTGELHRDPAARAAQPQDVPLAHRVARQQRDAVGSGVGLLLPVAADQVAPGVPGERGDEPVLARRPSPPRRPRSSRRRPNVAGARSTSCSASTSASRAAIALGEATSSRPGRPRRRPCRMLKVARRTRPGCRAGSGSRHRPPAACRVTSRHGGRVRAPAGHARGAQADGGGAQGRWASPSPRRAGTPLGTRRAGTRPRRRLRRGGGRPGARRRALAAGLRVERPPEDWLFKVFSRRRDGRRDLPRRGKPGSAGAPRRRRR